MANQARIRFSMLCFPLVALGTALALTSPVTAAAAGAGSGGDLTDAEHCQPVTYRGATFVDASGREVPAGPGVGTVHHFEITSGDDIREVVPPADFDPTRASDAALAAFGFTPRPVDPIAAATWARDHANYKARANPGVPVAMCIADKSAFSASANWSGIEATGYTDYRRAYGSSRVPNFTAVCPTASDLALWSGLGGDGPPGTPLLQNGFDSHQSTLQGMNAWWEGLGGGEDTHQVVVDSNFAASGELVKSDTYYQSHLDSNGIDTGQATFNWSNLTSGGGYQVIVTSALGRDIKYDYDGSTAEFIDERSTKSDGSLYLLRQYGVAGWTDAYVARSGQPATGVGNLPHQGLDMTKDGTYGTSTLSELYGRSMASSINWNMKWDACGN